MVQIKFKTLQGREFPMDIPADSTVGHVKSMIEAAQGADFSADRQKLIHQGKVLNDDKAFASYEIKESDFVVVMTTKKPASSSAPSPAPASSSTMATGATTTSSSSSSSNASTSAPPVSSGPPSPPPGVVDQLKEMGFPEDQVRAALRASGNNPELAIEYLFSGAIPTGPPAPGGALGGVGGLNLLGGDGGGNAGTTADLLNHPEMENIRRLIQENPSSLEGAIANLEASHPDLMRIINEDPESFWAALEGGRRGGTSSAGRRGAGTEGEEDDGGDDDEGEGGAEGEAAVGGAQVLTAEDEAAIARLQEMGFGRDQVVQAYLVSNKDENVAVNYLLG